MTLWHNHSCAANVTPVTQRDGACYAGLCSGGSGFTAAVLCWWCESRMRLTSASTCCVLLTDTQTHHATPINTPDHSAHAFTPPHNGLIDRLTCSWSPAFCSDSGLVQWYARTYTHTFNGPFPGISRWAGTSQVKTNSDFNEARDSEWPTVWHQLGHMQVYTSLQADNHASTSTLSVFYRPDALPAAQPTASKHWRHSLVQWQ